MSMSATCQICNNTSDLGKSHIIPASFFKVGQVEGETPFLASNKPGSHTSRRPAGEYDSDILCKKCERTFDEWDDYAKKFLLDAFTTFEAVYEGEKVLGYQAKTFDYKSLKLFFLSVLWRAGISKRPFFEKVRLGPHKHALLDRIQKANPGGKDDYAIQLFRFSGVDYHMPILMPLGIRSTYGIRYTRIYLGKFFYDVKVDSRPTPKNWQQGLLCEDQPLMIPCIDVRKADEMRILERILNNPTNSKD